MEAIKKLLRKFKFTSDLYEVCILSRKYLRVKGWFHSRFMRSAVDADKKPIPWFTYSAKHFIEQKLKGTNLDVFEFGSGNSTIWFADRVKSIVSVEYDEKYFDIVAPKLKDRNNVEYRKAFLGVDYHQQIEEFEEAFDIVIIDGRERVECAKSALPALRSNGVIIWDNSEREEYAEGYELIREAGFKEVFFQGLGPIGHYEWQTTIFYKDGNCLGI